MSNDEKELVENYRKLDRANQANALSNLRVALAAQENTKKTMTAQGTDSKRKTA